MYHTIPIENIIIHYPRVTGVCAYHRTSGCQATLKCRYLHQCSLNRERQFRKDIFRLGIVCKRCETNKQINPKGAGPDTPVNIHLKLCVDNEVEGECCLLCQNCIRLGRAEIIFHNPLMAQVWCANKRLTKLIEDNESSVEGLDADEQAQALKS